MPENEKTTKTPLLQYNKGELIIKEGDYGISVYKINKGKISIFKEWDDKKATVAILGPGEVIGETAFLYKGSKTRTTSARAVEDSELEVWHPSILAEEYEQLPYMIKYLANEMLRSLNRMNKHLIKLHIEQKQRGKKEEKVADPWESRRISYRKPVNLPCVYRPVPSPQYVNLQGQIADISRGGLRLNVRIENSENFPHSIGHQFIVNTALPNGKEIELHAKIVTAEKSGGGKRLIMGLEFIEISHEHQKDLGFFLMA